MSNYNLTKIINSNLCLGCGLCEAICGKDSVEMQLNSKGFYYPNINELTVKDDQIIKTICPSTNVILKEKLDKREQIWGHIKKIYEGYSTEDNIRRTSSSGGIISSIAIYMLEHNIVDGVLHVGSNEQDYTSNKLKVSKTKKDIIRNCSSRYAPALMFNEIIQILDKNEDIYCFIGKPCDIAALVNLFRIYPKYEKRIKLKVSLICAGIPSYTGTNVLVNKFKPTFPIRNLKYRGDGWPGYFSFIDSANKTYKTTYDDSWGKTLNRYLNNRCKICPEGIGILADIAVGDSWETKNGYPVFNENKGRSLIIVRNKIGLDLITKINNSNKISIMDIDINRLQFIQPFQYNRRKFAGARILAYSLARQIQFNFVNLSIYRNLINSAPNKTIRNFIGTLKRAINIQ